MVVIQSIREEKDPMMYYYRTLLKRINSLDLVIISHPHDDHMMGIEELIGKYL